MEKSYDVLNSILNSASTVTRLQLASASEWENCLVIEKRFSGDIASDWLDKFEAEYIGIEAFLDLSVKNTSGAFIGIRIPAFKNNIETVLNMTRKFHDSDFMLSNFLDGFQKMFGKSLYTGHPDFLELGVVNHWKSFGAMCFWRSDDGSKFAAFENVLKTRLDFMSVLPTPAAIEFAFSTPVPHWIGVTVSYEKNGKYFLSLGQAESVLGNICE